MPDLKSVHGGCSAATILAAIRTVAPNSDTFTHMSIITTDEDLIIGFGFHVSKPDSPMESMDITVARNAEEVANFLVNTLEMTAPPVENPDPSLFKKIWMITPCASEHAHDGAVEAIIGHALKSESVTLH